MIKKIIQRTITFLFFSLLGVFISCDNLDSQDSIDVSETYGVVHFSVPAYDNSDSESRTVLPSEVDKEILYFTLRGNMDGESEQTISTITGKKVEYMSYSELYAASFNLNAGHWNFSITGYSYSEESNAYTELITGTADETIKSGSNSISFTMHPVESGVGSIKLTLKYNLTSDATRKVSKLNAKLAPIDNMGKVSETIAYDDTWNDGEEYGIFTLTAGTNYITLDYNKTDVRSGLYLLTMTVTTKCIIDGVENPILCDTYRSDVVMIASGSESTDPIISTKILDLRQVYPIEYIINTEGGTDAEWVKNDYPKYYSPYEKTNLPDSSYLANDNAAFVSWYDASGATAVEIGTNQTGVKRFYAKWREGGIYVDTVNGNDANEGDKPSRAFKTLKKALTVPTSSTVDYVITISGTIEVDGDRVSASGEPGEIAVTAAKSITLIGAGYNSETPDTIKVNDDVNSDISTLKIYTTVPVSIQKLTIEGGKGTIQTIGTETSTLGGAIYMTLAGAKLTLGEGTIVTGGTAAQGGGVCVDKTGSKLILNGGKIDSCGISGTTKGGGVYINPNCYFDFISGDIINNGYDQVSGGGIYCEGTIKIAPELDEDGTTRTISKNTAINGGGIYATDTASVEISDIEIENNKATDGAGIYNLGNLTLKSSTISKNIATNSGGGIYTAYNTSAIEISNVHIKANEATDGAGIYNAGKLTLKPSTVSFNIATNAGGGVYNSGTLTMEKDGTDVPTIYRNNAVSGGGVYNVESKTIFTMSAGSITSNNATDGGGVYSTDSATFTMSGGTIGSNTATTNGGGVYSTDSATFAMAGGTVGGNTATTAGGGVFSAGTMFMYGTAVIGDASASSASDVSNSNSATERGGGIYNDGSLYLGYSDADNTSSLNGGVYSNYAVDGGGIYNAGSGTCYFASGSVANNAAATSGSGGGVYNSGIVFMHGSAVIGNDSATTYATTNNYSNTAGYGGGVFNNNKFYLGKSSVSDETPLTGGIYYNSSTSGAGIYNDNDSAELLMLTGFIKYNFATGETYLMAGGGGVYNKDGTFTMKGGCITCNGANGYGGGVSNLDSMFMTGNAVIGFDEDNAIGNAIVFDEEHAITASNYATYGGGVYNCGTLKLGYANSSDTEGTVLTGGIFYNYSTGGPGGGVFNALNFYINTGKILKNTASSGKKGVFTALPSGNTSITGGEIQDD